MTRKSPFFKNREEFPLQNDPLDGSKIEPTPPRKPLDPAPIKSDPPTTRKIKNLIRRHKGEGEC